MIEEDVRSKLSLICIELKMYERILRYSYNIKDEEEIKKKLIEHLKKNMEREKNVS